MPHHDASQNDVAPSASDLLRKIPYFCELGEAAVADIARTVHQHDVQGGEEIFAAGEPCEGLYFVVSGQVRLIKSSADGRELVLRVLGPGATFNDVAVFDGGPNSDSAVAVGPTKIGFIPKAVVTALIDQQPTVAKAALKILSARQRSLGHMIEDLALREVIVRVARLLLGCMGRHDHVVEKAESACARITQQEIASMVGSVREVVQRALKELERDGAISLERTRVDIRDAAKLERWAETAEGD